MDQSLLKKLVKGKFYLPFTSIQHYPKNSNAFRSADHSRRVGVFTLKYSQCRTPPFHGSGAPDGVTLDQVPAVGEDASDIV